MSIEKTVTNLETLKINYLTDAMYEDALENNQINENELYMTPSNGITSIPTADTIAEFDSNAHMNSTDMTSTEISDFINGLNIDGSSIINILHPVGSCYVTSTNTNPSLTLGGTWQLIDKRFKAAWITSGFTFNTTNTQSGSFACALHGNTAEFRFIWQNKVAISDTTTPIGTLNKATVGLAGGHTIYAVGYGDGLNAVGMFSFNLGDSTVTLNAYDWVTRATSYPTATGQNCDLSMIISLQPSEMLDSFCNQFIWQRTA